MRIFHGARAKTFQHEGAEIFHGAIEVMLHDEAMDGALERHLLTPLPPIQAEAAKLDQLATLWRQN